MRLCRRSFLSLWAHANLHTAQDMREGKGSAKEFADVLVVFGDDVIIFSDKHIAFQQEKDVGVAWRRWFKRAIADSARQLHGAMGWLQRFPDRIFLDAACRRPLPVSLPTADTARYHLVAVTRGSLDACKKMFPGSFGTLQVNTEIEGRLHEEAPFTIGMLDRSKHFVHVFDEFSLEVAMGEFDTITDFIAYLNARRFFLGDAELTVVAAGEEQLIAAYISNGDDSPHPFLPDSVGPQSPDLVIFDGSHYPGLIARPEYRMKREQDRRSRVWDALLERLIQLGDPKLVHTEVQQSNHETERGLRLMAAESRFRRHLLTDALIEMLDAAEPEPNKRRARVFSTHEQPELVYIFLVTPKGRDETNDAYRRHRVALLHAYCRCAKLRLPQGVTFIGLGLDHPAKSYAMSSEDVIVFTCNEYTPQEKAEAESFQRELGILAEGLVVKEGFATEFPIAPTILAQQHQRRGDRDGGKKKRKSKQAQASRRRNRR